MRTIGTAVIVKNESEVIRRCLTSLIPIVDYFLVVDTGSTDGTQQIIRDFIAENGLRGEVVEETWRDFAYNRSSALAHLRKHRDIDYALIIDADDELVFDANFDPTGFKSAMDRDLYDVEIRYGTNRYHRPQILRNAMEFRFRGVLHEFVEGPPEGFTRADAAGFHIAIRGGGARSQDPGKFRRDAAMLEKALAVETDPFLVSRYTFYLAQSYRDCGDKQKALDNYLKRAGQGHWIEEVFVSLYEAGKLRAALGHAPDSVIAAFMQAAASVPARAEALHGASRYCRDIGRNAEALDYARRGADMPMPAAGLFVETWIYDYGLLDEVAINAYFVGAYRESLDACLRILAGGKLPASEFARVVANARRAAAAEEAPANTTAHSQTRPAQVVGTSTSSYGRWTINPPSVPNMARGAGAAQPFDRGAVQRLLQEIGTGLLFGGGADAAIDRLQSWGAPATEARRIVETALSDPLIVNGREMALMLRKRDWLLASLERLQQLSPRARTIERRSELSGGEFLELYYSRNRPVVILGEMDGWPARSKWTLPYLGEAAGLAPGGGGIVAKGDEAEIDIAMSAPAFGLLSGDLGALEKFLDRTTPPRDGVLRIARQGAFTPLHFDARNRLVAQIAGRTRIKLAAATDVPLLYNRAGVTSEADDLDAADPARARRFPLLAQVKAYEIELDPGEILFVPMAWWIQSRALDIGVSATFVNFRWPNDMDRRFPIKLSVPEPQ